MSLNDRVEIERQEVQRQEMLEPFIGGLQLGECTGQVDKRVMQAKVSRMRRTVRTAHGELGALTIE